MWLEGIIFLASGRPYLGNFQFPRTHLPSFVSARSTGGGIFLLGNPPDPRRGGPTTGGGVQDWSCKLVEKKLVGQKLAKYFLAILRITPNFFTLLSTCSGLNFHIGEKAPQMAIFWMYSDFRYFFWTRPNLFWKRGRNR